MGELLSLLKLLLMSLQLVLDDPGVCGLQTRGCFDQTSMHS